MDTLAQFQKNIDGSDIVVVVGASYAQWLHDIAEAARHVVWENEGGEITDSSMVLLTEAVEKLGPVEGAVT